MAAIYIREAVETDLPRIMEIINQAKALLKADGSPQWQNGKPNEDVLTEDINQKHCWVLMVGNEIAGTATLLDTDDPNYAQIDGDWITNGVPYTTIHRIALSADFRGQHLSDFFFSNLISLSLQKGFSTIRIDTHALNQRMQHLIQKNGFKFCGIVHVEPGKDGERKAYELQL